MTKWTLEQQLAIDKDNTNIIVSAGAGSGKTAVLTERVIRKLKDGVNVNELLVLTFTNAAAAEMKSRIKSAIKENNLDKQLSLIDGAYITTFDSYSLSIVKKYNYLLNVSKNINICEKSLIDTKKKKFIDEIFDYLYEQEDLDFLSMISSFCIKSDSEIKKSIINISSSLDLLYDKDIYLNNYINEYYNEFKIDNDINIYIDTIKNKINKINLLLTDFANYVDIDIFNKVNVVLSNLINSDNYDDIKNYCNISNPIIKGLEDIAKNKKSQIFEVVNEIKDLCFYKDINEIKDTILSTKGYAKAIIKIIKLLDDKMNDFKYQNDLYEFVDISKMAIKLVDKFIDVRNEIKESFNEIMVDEYQDTSDLQELFISFISNNNVYMVGDIKQSIYRFRNANPYIFKNKYDNYSKGNDGFKIDLVKNFRSRKEVLESINLLFNSLMDDDLGGANYIKEHQMVFGNFTYENEAKTEQNANIEIYNYKYTKESEYTRDEIEIFTIANDIKEKIDSNYKVYDKNERLFRPVTYNDFSILIDRSTSFDLYKKVFEYLNIPLTKYTDTVLTDKYDILIIKNIIDMLILLKNKDYDTSFKYAFTSIARSFLFRYSDEEIFEYIDNFNYKDSSIVKIALDIISDIDSLSILDIFNLVIDKYDFYNNLIKVSNIEDSFIRIEALYNIAANISNIGYNIEDLSSYLNELIEMSREDSSKQIKITINDLTNDSVKIMTIHKSKGLEFPICYFSGLYKTFNLKESTNMFGFSNRYGFILPYYNNGIGNTIYKKLYRDNYIKEEISEKIRLWYVALTRAKEKLIVVCSLDEETTDIDMENRYGYRSLLDIMNGLKSNLSSYITNIDTNNINISKDYLLIKSFNYKNSIEKDNRKIIEKEISIDNEVLINKTYSKHVPVLISNETKNNMKFGEYMHYLFEVIDFKNPNLDKFDIELEYKDKINMFLSLPIDFKNAKIYKEYEFIYKDNNSLNHGIIDLMLEYDDKIIIIDYKLSNIEDDNYYKQLNGYKTYISNKTNKQVEIYLYSILGNELKGLG